MISVVCLCAFRKKKIWRKCDRNGNVMEFSEECELRAYTRADVV